MLAPICNLNDLDFLPANYRDRGLRRRATIWRTAIVFSCGWFFVAAAILHRSHRMTLESNLAQVELQQALAVGRNAQVAKVHVKLNAERSAAALLTFLRHPWPRTRIISAVMEPLPESITLTEFHLSHEAVRQNVAPATLRDDKTPATDKPSRQIRDLARLLRERLAQQYFVTLVGYTNEAAELHEYLARLGANPLFSKIDLRSIENLPADKNAGQNTDGHHFTATAILRDSPGQMSPAKPAAPSPQLAGGHVAEGGNSNHE